jgi:hypothetical protein
LGGEKESIYFSVCRTDQASEIYIVVDETPFPLIKGFSARSIQELLHSISGEEKQGNYSSGLGYRGNNSQRSRDQASGWKSRVCCSGLPLCCPRGLSSLSPLTWAAYSGSKPRKPNETDMRLHMWALARRHWGALSTFLIRNSLLEAQGD